MTPEDIRKLGDMAFARGIAVKLRPHKERKLPVFGFDTEYDSRTGDLVCWQIASDAGGALFESPLTLTALREAVAPYCGRKREAVLVAYYSLAELQFLPLFERGVNVQEASRGSINVTFAVDGFKLHIYDVSRFFDGQSLYRAAEAFGFEKLTFAAGRENVSRELLKDEAFRRYAIHDAVITRGIFCALRSELLRDGVDILQAPTAASAAASYFRHAYLCAEIVPPPARARGLAMRGVWGGRAEAFVRGKWPKVYEYDLRSAYPSAAVAIGIFPNATDWYFPSSLRELLNSPGGYARVTFRFPSTEKYPCLPVHHKGSMLYPTAGESYCTSYEIALALERGVEIKLLDATAYRTGDTSLARFMRDAMAERAVAKGARKTALKLYANSLIGKLAQRRATPGAREVEKLARSMKVSVVDFAGMTLPELVALGLQVEPRLGAVWAPEWNGLITGYVRAQVSRAVIETGAVYCATDAVWTLRPWKHGPEWEEKRAGEGAVFRTRLGYLGSDHTVYHAWSNRAAARSAMDSDAPRAQYDRRRLLHYREALQRGKRAGNSVSERMTGSTLWDGKRVLLSGGDTRPLSGVAEYDQLRSQRCPPKVKKPRKPRKPRPPK